LIAGNEDERTFKSFVRLPGVALETEAVRIVESYAIACEREAVAIGIVGKRFNGNAKAG
jgi:hypothetical protein